MGKTFNFDVIDVHTHVVEHLSGIGYRGEVRAIGNGKARWATGEEFTVFADGCDTFSYEKLIQQMDKNNISKSILMQGSYLGFCNDYTYEAQQKYPKRLYGMGTFDPYGAAYLKIMRRLIETFRFRGLKFEMSEAYGFMGYHPDFKLDGERMRTVFEYADERELVISLDMGTFGEPSFQIDKLVYVVQRYPHIRFVIEHLFFPGRDHYEDMQKTLGKLENLENLYFTTASIPASIQPEKYPYPSVRRYLEIAKQIIGAGRLMWGSDLPTVLGHGTYEELKTYIVDLGIFDEKQLKQIYFENAVKVYGL